MTYKNFKCAWEKLSFSPYMIFLLLQRVSKDPQNCCIASTGVFTAVDAVAEVVGVPGGAAESVAIVILLW